MKGLELRKLASNIRIGDFILYEDQLGIIIDDNILSPIRIVRFFNSIHSVWSDQIVLLDSSEVFNFQGSLL